MINLIQGPHRSNPIRHIVMVRGGWHSTSRGGGGTGGGDECVREKEIVQLSDGIYGP